MVKRIPWDRVSANIIRRNPSEWINVVETRGNAKSRTVNILYKSNPGGPGAGKIITRLPFKKGDKFYWIGGLVMVSSA